MYLLLFLSQGVFGLLCFPKIMSMSLFFSLSMGRPRPPEQPPHCLHPFSCTMVNCRISRDVKERAIALFRDMDLKSITHVLDVSTHSISRWIFNVSIYGDVGPPKSPLKGRPRVCKSSTLDRLTKFLLKNPTVYLDEVQFWLSVEEVILISISTIHRYQKYVLGFT